MKRIICIYAMLCILFFSACKTAPEQKPVDSSSLDTSVQVVPSIKPEVRQNPAITPPPAREPAAQVKPVEDDNTIVAQFDTVSITKQTFNKTKSAIQLVVEDLNHITFSKDFNRWQTYLSDEYRKVFSDPATLQKVSASLPIKGIQLQTLQDYFTYVFVPSRQNMRVDDIQFVSPTRVYVIMEIAPKSPAAIYILENTPDGWKLVPKNQ